MFERTPELDRDSSRADRTREIRTPGRMRDGHRREYDPREAREQMSFGERSEQALAGCGDLPRRLVPGPGRSSLRRPSLHGPAGRESVDSPGADVRTHSQGTEGWVVPGADALPNGVRKKLGALLSSGVWTLNSGPGPG